MSSTDVNIIKAERQLRHFGFTPVEFISEFRCCVQTNVEGLLAMLKTVVPEAANKEKVDMDEWRQTYLNHCEKSVKNLENCSRELFNIPENVLLPGDIAVGDRVSDERLEKLQQEVSKLEEKFCEETYNVGMMKTLQQQYNTAEPIYRVTDRYLEWLGSGVVTLSMDAEESTEDDELNMSNPVDRKRIDKAVGLFW